jgi:hypothetical protein
MRLDQLKPNIVVRGATFPEPLYVIVVVPMGKSVKLIGKGLTSGKVHEQFSRPSSAPGVT